MKKIKYFLLGIPVMLVGNSFGQLTVSTGLTPTQYVQNNLIGQGVTISNVTYVGNAFQLGSFNGANSNIGFTDGIVLGSTAISELTGVQTSQVNGQVNTSGTVVNPVVADLLTVAQSVTTNPSAQDITQIVDLSLLEFDFVPQSDVVSFNFVFGSDEYTTYINSLFNDVFGFFVSGPGISGPYSAPAGFPNGSANLALVPTTNVPITISTIYPANTVATNPAGLNPQYYFDNTGGTTNALNGFTVPIPITFNVVCGETYHFKFAVADCEDNFLGTVVFLEGGSFTSPPINLTLSNAQGSNDIIEACSDADFLFTRSLCQSQNDLIINYTLSGSATQGTDYSIAQASPITIPAGEDSLAISLTTFADALTEGAETITIDISYIDQFGNPQTSTGTFFLNDIQPLAINTSDTLIRCQNQMIEIFGVGSGGTGNFIYDWQDSNSDSSSTIVALGGNGTYYFPVTITDQCLGNLTDSVQVIVNQTLVIDTMYTVNASACANDGVVIGQGAGNNGVIINHWEGPNTGGPSQINASVMQNLSAGWYVYTVTDNVCSVTDSIYLNQEPPPVSQFTPSALSGCDPLNITFTNQSQNAINYEWDFGNGNTANVNDLATQSQTYSSPATIRLIAINGPCRDTSYASIQISVCGCTDPIATNYNPLAAVNDGSCLYPEPIVIPANIFTPNGDQDNDFFTLNVINATELTLTIVNRWGNVVFEQTTQTPLLPVWDGKGSEDGVYFYKYVAKGLANKEITGQGFIQLIR